MGRVTRAAARQAAAPAASTSEQPLANTKDPPVREGHHVVAVKRRKANGESPRKRIKIEDEVATAKTLPKAVKPEPLDESLERLLPSLNPMPGSPRTKKLKNYTQLATGSPFPEFLHPTPEEARHVHRILASLHGARLRPEETKAPTARSGCGDSPSVLDALVRTILSQNTSETNSTRAKRSMDAAYGGSDNWEAIVAGGTSKLEEAIRCGGLSAIKSKVIIGVLSEVKERYGHYSLDHLFKESNEDAMKELIGFKGVGPKTASCVLLFCLRRESFAVDTHVWRITGQLGWRPRTASRDETHAHLDVRIPDEDKYGLHILLVTHGRRCGECKAGGKSLGKCELRKVVKEGGIS
ncbi:hypothetical protein IMZ48_25365 [Candidatus Bathyarchaeota archaeon]|nr:hypothetical protein [Candidatus Bathyarchaeota archaeon]